MPLHDREHHSGGAADECGWQGGALRAEEQLVQLHEKMDSGNFDAADVVKAIALFEGTSEWLQPIKDQQEADRLSGLAEQGEMLACELGRQLHNFTTPACGDWPVCSHSAAILGPHLAAWIQLGGHGDSELHPARVAGSTGALTVVEME